METENLSTPERTVELESLSVEAYQYLNEQQKIVEKQYRINDFENWFYDQESGILTFSNPKTGEGTLEIEYEQVGSISKISKTWLWSWDNAHIDEKVKTEIDAIFKYGIENNLEHLIKSKWNGDEYDGWEMTAITAYLMKAKGAYRFSLDNVFSFVVYKKIINKRTF